MVCLSLLLLRSLHSAFRAKSSSACIAGRMSGGNLGTSFRQDLHAPGLLVKDLADRPGSRLIPSATVYVVRRNVAKDLVT